MPLTNPAQALHGLAPKWKLNMHELISKFTNNDVTLLPLKMVQIWIPKNEFAKIANIMSIIICLSFLNCG